MKKRSVTVFIVICSFIYAAAAIAEQVTISTFHPSPVGSYQRITTTQDAYLATTAGNRVGIGTSTPGEKLDVSGNIRATGSVMIGNGVCDGSHRGNIVWDGTHFKGCSTTGWVNLDAYN